MAKSGKKTLKAALSSQQSRLKRNQKVIQAAQVKEKAPASSNVKAKGKGKALPRRSTMPFTAQDRILLIGEGNFSYAVALFKHPALEFLPACNVTATAYDSEEECHRKYPEAAAFVEDLKRRGVEVLFSVDATSLEKCKALKGRAWDRIVWNFPHAGKGITDQDRNILSNQLLLLGFLRSSAAFLTLGPIPTIHKKKSKVGLGSDDEEEDKAVDHESDAGSDDEGILDTASERIGSRGTILVTLRNVPPYTEWNLTKLAKNPPPPTSASAKPNPRYIQLRSFVFRRTDWDGYEHRMTKGERRHGSGKTGSGGEDRTWELCLKDSEN